MGVYDQHFESLLDKTQTPLDWLKAKFDISDQEGRASLGMFGLAGDQHLIRMSALSGGQKARVVFASLRLMKPHILLLDEPTNHLDLESVDALIEGLKVREISVGSIVRVVCPWSFTAAGGCLCRGTRAG